MTTLRRPRIIGGARSTWAERLPALRKFRETEGETVNLGWKAQCYCGSTEAKRYRKAWWCPRCGREKIETAHITLPKAN